MWPLISTIFGWVIVCRVVGKQLDRRRRRKIAERQRAAAMQYRDAGTLDELDRDM